LSEEGRLGKGLFSGQPESLSTLFFAELWERFSYYGMRALLVLFMVAPVAEGGLAIGTAEAARLYGNYTMAVYMLAIPGGFIADHVLGARRSVMLGGVVIALGHFTLAAPSATAFYAGLTLVALGTGLFKPNISALVGRLYAPGDERRDAGFSIYYMGINIGAFLAPLVTGFLAQSDLFKSWLSMGGFDPERSWHWGFAAAGVGMTVSLIVLARRIAHLGPPDAASSGERSLAARSLAVLGGTALLMGLVMASDRPGLEWLRVLFLALPAAAAVLLGIQRDPDLRRLAAIAVLFVASMVFWAIFEQAGLSIALFADELTRRELLGLTFPSAWFQSLNALFVILLAPLFALMWTRLGARQPSSPLKFTLGLAFLAASFVMMVPAAMLASEGKVSPLWLVGLFFVQTIGELLLSPVGLSTMTRLAPARVVGLVLGVWFLAAAFGNKLAGILGASFDAGDPGALVDFFVTQATLVAIAALLLLALSPWVKRLMGDVR
jgi:POT family proton-dependent oligopeptide transporter